MIGVSGNINGGAQIFINWFGMPMWTAQLVYYVIAGCVVFMGMKAVGIAQKYAVVLLIGIVAAMTAGTLPLLFQAVPSLLRSIQVWRINRSR